MKVIALTVLHYGRPYLQWAMRSLVDHVDEYWILYSSTPSHNGGLAALPNPDSEAELYEIAKNVAGDKLRWITGQWKFEGQQRDAIFDLCPDADVILIADYDEVWGETLIANSLEQHSEAQLIGCSRWRVPFIHYWRSFHKAVLHDPALPVRVIFPQVEQTWEGDGYINCYGNGHEAINHLGYAIPVEYMAYKWSGIHGHQGELRKDVDWLNDVYVANRQSDTHPVGSEFWQPERVDPLSYMPRWMMQHPYYQMSVIE